MFFLASIYPIEMMLPPDREFRQPFPSLLLPSMQNILVHFYKCNEDLVVAGSGYKILHGKRHFFFQICPQFCICWPFVCVFSTIVSIARDSMSHLQNQKSCQPPFVLGKVTAKGGGRIDNPKYSRPSSSETNKGKGYKRENLVFFHTFCRKPRLNTFDICATAVMGIKRLAIQLDPVETSSRCCVYIRRET
jgi:hypothetical protein